MDGTQLVNDPVKVLQDIQSFLQLTDTVDYSKYLKYDKQLHVYVFIVATYNMAIKWNFISWYSKSYLFFPRRASNDHVLV